MKRPTEKLALKLMVALQEEAGRSSNDLTRCRKLVDVSGGIIRDQEEFDRCVNYLGDLRLLHFVRRADGMAALPSEGAIEWIEAHKFRWTFERRFIAYGLVVTVLLAAIALLWQLARP
jgi:hypothetical protein